MLICLAQTGNIHGHIEIKIDNFGLPGVQIELLNTKIKTSSDTIGNFTLPNIPEGNYTMRVSFLGEGHIDFTDVTVKCDSTLQFNIPFPWPCIYEKSRNNKTCPVCGKQDQVIPIIYGYPNKKMLRKAAKNKILIGGCLVFDCQPNWYCKRDFKKF
jgi:CarboxypepD_reg-like domain